MLFVEREGRLIPELLAGEGNQSEKIRISDAATMKLQKPDPHFHFQENLQKHLSGRKLLIEEIPFSLQEIHRHAEAGFVRYEPGMKAGKKGFMCFRCGNDEKNMIASFPCARCGKDCVYCRKCLMMGRVSQCTPLITWHGPEVEFFYDRALQWEGTLSPSQAKASQKIRSAVLNGEELLVWAVCGAGKTEMLFEGIAAALQAGKRVAIATPRTDVVLELAPRMKEAFPNIPIAALYGGSEDRHRFAPLVITTTHQLLRFDKAFDCMIIDEVDAFPYSADTMLQRAAEKARKEKGSLIFLTATPKESWQKECYGGKRNCFILPARYHRHSLPIPRFIWIGKWEETFRKGAIPRPLLQWFLKRLENGKQAFIFFPKIDLLEQVLPLFKNYDPKIAAVHSEDPERKEKVQAIRERKIQILLTTTILERGVTIPNLDVAVVGAEDEIFTESALVQIAGRVGRNPKYPTGDIAFFHYGKTRAMERARNQLLRMNREARKQGLIDD